MIGRSLGDYKILESLGGGSYGTVYRAEHARSGNLVAIKLLHLTIATAESQRVINEARAAAAIRHRNVVQVYDMALTTDQRPYIVMQLLDGLPLSRILEQRLSVARALALATDILRGLAAAHARGVIHRDLKPDNIYVASGRAVIVDFGLAKLVAVDPARPGRASPWPGAPNLTVTGEAIGTPHYMAPEQIRARPVDHRADLYAVGCVLYQMLVGRPPFDATAPFALFDAHINHPPPPIARPDVPPHVAAAIARALAKDPAERWPDADAMRRALAAPAATRRRRWPLVAAPLALGAGIVAIAIAARGSDAPSATMTAPAQAGRHTVPFPAPRSGDPPLPPAFENALHQMHDLVVKGMYARATGVMMLCKLDEAYRSGLGIPTYRAYLRRSVELFRTAFPDIDLATECRR